MTATQGPAGVPYTYPLFGSPTGLPADAPILSPNEFGAPTAVLGGAQAAAVWRFEASEAGTYRIDAALTIRLSKTPMVFNHAFATYYYVYKEGVGLIVSSSTDFDTEDSTGQVFDYSPGSTFWIIILPQEYDLDTFDTFPTASWAVPRISGPGVVETVQLPDRDCVVAFADSQNFAPAERDFEIGVNNGDGLHTLYLASFLHGLHWGTAILIEPFGLPSGNVATYAGAWHVMWDVARGQQAGGIGWYSQDYLGFFTSEPTGPPDVLPGPDSSTQYPDSIPLSGWDLTWDDGGFGPGSAEVRTFAAGFQLRHQQLLSIAGKLGDGTQDSALDTDAERIAALTQYLDNADTLGPPQSIIFSATTCQMLALHFTADEAPTSWADPGAVGDPVNVWMTSLPEVYADGEAPEWGTYRDDTGQLLLSNRQKPEDWTDATLTVVGVNAALDWVEIDWEACKAYQDAVEASLGTSLGGYLFYVFPAQMWTPEGPIGAKVASTGSEYHYRPDPRFALREHVRPAPFVAFWDPVLEPAEPDYPEIAAAPGPDRAAFWPQ